MNAQRLVLRNKASGKIASRKDQRRIALILEAERLAAGGQGGGITSLLLPNSPREKAGLAKIRKIYTVCRVKTRPGSKSRMGDRNTLHSAVNDDFLIAKLAVLFGEHIGDKPGPQMTSVKAFTRWLKKELKNTKSIAYKTALKLAPVLLEVERSDRWWESAFAERRKTQS